MKVKTAATALVGGALSVVLAFSQATEAAPSPAPAAVAPAEAGARCEALRTADFSGVEDAPTSVFDVRVVAGQGASPARCEVRGYVAPNIGFLAWLPAGKWNGKIIQGGCGGACGTLDGIAQCEDPLKRGYACIVSDGGHRSGMQEMKWAFNNPQTLVDYYVRGPHVTLLAGKAIVQRYFAKTPEKSYFYGCSSGGTQALVAAQRFPWDYDGIISVSPAISLGETMLNHIYGNQAIVDAKGTPLLSRGDMELLHSAVVARCDRNDGVVDGLIGDPRQCRFDPVELQCKPGSTGQCLSASAVAAAQKLYAGPMTSKGLQIVPPQAMKGTERDWWFYYPENTSPFVYDWFRYFAFQPNPGPGWDPKSFDFDHDYQRMGASTVVDPSDPDLRPLQRAGGKLLLVTGWDDIGVSVPRTVDYYEAAERLLGGRDRTQPFFRTFISPGMGHCGGGPGASRIDYLTYLEDWAERGEAPDRIVAYKTKSEFAEWMLGGFPLDPSDVEFTRPVYPYPVEARYKGKGEVRDAASFGPVAPKR